MSLEWRGLGSVLSWIVIIRKGKERTGTGEMHSVAWLLLVALYQEAWATV